MQTGPKKKKKKKKNTIRKKKLIFKSLIFHIKKHPIF
jgi:hypothetical protein